jgi:prepilin-type N-terminal cleavage/methylation domain-containing protein
MKLHPRDNPAATVVCDFARRARAFTLLELLVALAMAAIIAGSLYASLRSGFRARAQAEAQVEPVRTAELATALLRADFESARPADGTLSGPFVGQDLTGDQGLAADSVSFFTLGNPTDPLAAAAATAGAPADMSGVGLTPTTGEARQVEIAITSYPGPGGAAEPCLVRRVNTNLLAQVTAEPYEEVLCRGVRSLNVRYYDGLTWQDSWDSTTLDNAIPVAVEVTLELDRSTEGQQRIIQFPRVFLLSCSTLSATSTAGTGGAAGGTGQ